MGNIRVTRHACERFAERAPCSLSEARDRILAAARGIEAPAAFGCEVVRLGTGERLVLDGLTVVTVYARDMLPRKCRHTHHHLGDGEWL